MRIDKRVSQTCGQEAYFVTPPIIGITANGGNEVREVITYLQQVHTIRLHAVHPLTYGFFHDWSGHLRRSKYTPLCCPDDFDRRLDVFDGPTLSTIINEKKGK